MATTLTLTKNPELVTVGSNTAQVATVTLTGTSGTANITVAGGLTKLVTFNTSLTQTATDFDTTHSAAYTTAGITVTTSGADIIFTAAVAGTPFDAPVITNITGDLAGTVVATTANNSVSADIDFEDVLPFKTKRSVTGYAMIERVSGTTVQFSCNGEEITAASAAVNATQTKLILPLTRGVDLKHKGGAGAETYYITIVTPDHQ